MAITYLLTYNLASLSGPKCPGQSPITKYKQKFEGHIIYFPSLGELDKVSIFVNGLDNHIKFMVKAYSPKTLYKAYGGPFMMVVKNGKTIS
jgi:hypothetical protein